jgi:DNA-binding FadR family transcriptional regulator
MSDRYLRLGMAIPDSVDAACRQHHAIFNAIRSRDEEAIRTTMSTHLTLADDAIRALELAEGAARGEPVGRRAV